MKQLGEIEMIYAPDHTRFESNGAVIAKFPHQVRSKGRGVDDELAYSLCDGFVKGGIAVWQTAEH